MTSDRNKLHGKSAACYLFMELITGENFSKDLYSPIATGMRPLTVDEANAEITPESPRTS